MLRRETGRFGHARAIPLMHVICQPEEENVMSRITKLFVNGFLALAAFAPIAGARPAHVVFRGFYGPAFYGPGWYGWYGPGWVAAYGYGPSAGSVKIDS